jgi:hypothetical protein
MTGSPKVDKVAVLSFLADQVAAKEQVVATAEVELEKLSDSNDVGSEDWLPPMLVLTAAKAMKASFEKVAEYVIGLEQC